MFCFSQGIAQDTINIFRTNITRQNNYTTSLAQNFLLNKRVKYWEYSVRQSQELLYNQTLLSQRLVQGNTAAQIWIKRNKGKYFNPVIWWESDAFLNNNNARSQLYAGYSIRPFAQLEFIPLYGYNIDIRNGRMDEGATPALFARWQSARAKEYDFMVQGFSRVKYIAPRRQDNHRVEFQGNKYIGEEVRLWFSSLSSFHEMDDYQAQSIQRLLSDTLNFHTGINYTLLPGLVVELGQRLTRQNRNYRFAHLYGGNPEFNTSGFRQDELQTQIKVAWQRQRLMGWVGYEYLLLDRTYRLANDLNLGANQFSELLKREAEKNYRSAFQKWSVFLRYRLHTRHAIETEYSSQYLRYDTPLNSNFDDRDEVTYIVRCSWEARWRRNFRMIYETTGQSRYSGFLSGTRSRDNYHQYNLKMRAASDWQFHPDWNLKTDQAVYVTYNVKTFGDPQFTDRSVRFLENMAELSGSWHRRWRSTFTAERKVQMLAYLNWPEFSESPLDTTRYITLQNKHEYTWGGKARHKTWTVGIGYRHFILQRNLIARVQEMPDNRIRLQMINRQSGPLSDCAFHTRKGNRLGFSIWWQRQKVFNKETQVDEELYPAQNIPQQELYTVQKILRPYFEIHALWLF